jgi:hypothetical protein
VTCCNESIFAALHERGHSPLPISRRLHPSDPKAFGKAPGIYGGIAPETGEARWFLLKGWQAHCIERVTIHRARAWGRMVDSQNGGLGVACGYNDLIGIDIDDETLIGPLNAVLPSIMVAKRGRKGLTAFYRGEHPRSDIAWWQKKNYPGLLDFLANGSQSVLPPSIHPDTDRPYEWATPRTLLDTPVSELPAFTDEHRANMEEVLRAHGWDAPEPAQLCSEVIEQPARFIAGTPHDDDFSRACVAGRAAYLPLLGLAKLTRVAGGCRAIASFRLSGSGTAEHKRGLSLSIRDDGAIFDHGTGEGFNDVTLVARCLFNSDNGQAFAWLRNTLGIQDGPQISVKPSRQNNRVSLKDAAARLERVMDEFDATVQNGIAIRNRERLKRSLIIPKHPVIRIRSEAGVGKSAIAKAHCATQTKLGRRMIYVVPNHQLAAEVVADFASHGVEAKVYRGYEQDDPRNSTFAMCRNTPAYESARALSLSTRSEICERRINGKIVQCPFAKDCGMERQRELKPQVWIITSAMLFIKRPDFIVEPDGIVIDESFIDGAIGETAEIDMTALLGFKVEGCAPDEADAVDLWRARLAAAIQANGDGPLSRSALTAQGISAAEASNVSYLERRRLFAHLLRPDMKEGEIKTISRRHAKANAMARAATTLWQEVETFLAEGDHPDFYGDRTLSGRLTVAGGKVSVTPLRIVHRDWRACPTLILDATAPPANLLMAVLGEIDVPGLPPLITSEPDLAAKWSPHVHARQIIHAPVTMGKLGLAGTSKPQNVKAILRYIKQRTALAAPARIGLITYKGLLEQLSGQLPGNVVTLHFGNLAGMNNMQAVVGLIVIGRPRPPKAVIEATASVLAGTPVVTDGPFYTHQTSSIQLADGSGFGVANERHLDCFAEAIRSRKTEGELEQAVGRIRPHRRTEPCWLDIVSDVALPVTVHEVVTWEDVEPGAEADMMAVGVVLGSSRDSMDAFRLSKRDAEAVSITAPKTLYSNLKSYGGSFPTRKFFYRVAGRRGPGGNGHHLPGVLPGGEQAVRKMLESKLGPLATLRIERVKVKDSIYAQAILAGIGLDSTAHLESIGQAFEDVEVDAAAAGEIG